MNITNAKRMAGRPNYTAQDVVGLLEDRDVDDEDNEVFFPGSDEEFSSNDEDGSDTDASSSDDDMNGGAATQTR